MSGNHSEASKPSNFTAQNSTAEDLLKEQTVGLVNFSDFRKRRFEAIEHKEKTSQGQSSSANNTPAESRASTPSKYVCERIGRIARPAANGSPSATSTRPKKRKKPKAVNKLSFGDDEDDGEGDSGSGYTTPAVPRTRTPAIDTEASNPQVPDEEVARLKRLGPNSSITNAPRLLTKAALAKESQVRETLRKEFLEKQKIVRATEIAIPFVFYDGSNNPGGTCSMQKGDPVWLFLDKSRKLGAEHGVGDSDKSKKEWARISVDDLMMVRGELIIPPHYEFYYFLINNVETPKGRLFSYSADPTSSSPALADLDIDLKNYDPLSRPNKTKSKSGGRKLQDLEGWDDDPSLTRVVDRRWYEKNKHIYPASVWQEFDPAKEYVNDQRRDTHGNAFFYS